MRWPLLPTLALLVLGGCTSPGGESTGPGWNVVFVLVDTLRADHLSLYGYERDTSPYLDRLATESILFEEVRSQASCTFPSVNSMLTSRYPAHFLGQPDRGMSIPDGIPSLAEILSARGYDTAAVSSSVVVRQTPSSTNRHGGFDRGFDTFDETCLRDDAGCVNEQGLAVLAEMEEPFLLYLHYVDPHAPYQPPSDYRRRFAVRQVPQRWVMEGNIKPLVDMLYRDGPEVELSPIERQHLIALYDDEIAYFDRALEQLVEHLRASGALERTLLVFASDHGDEFLEHGHVSHCRQLAWDTLLRTPLLVRIPGGPAGRRRALAQNLDIVPTVLDYLGVPLAPFGFEGRSLRPVIEEDRPVNRYHFAAQGRSRIGSDERYKLVFDIEEESTVLFDLESDPGETIDRASELPEIRDRLERVVRAWIEATEGEVGGDSIRKADETEAELRAVGYL